MDAPCGDSSSSACDRPNSCDGSGACQTRQVSNDTPCDDGQFCTVGDRCQGGSCAPTGNRNCGANQSCNENANQCQCQGCVVANTCFASGATNGCQICDPSRSTTAFSPNVGANCGSAATACSAQDTCNAQGTCGANHLATGTLCGDRSSSSCDQPDTCDGNGACQTRRVADEGQCQDNLFCNSLDRCVGGTCQARGNPCGNVRSCDETSDQCRCPGATLTCTSPLGGSPNCSTWDFEAETTEGWAFEFVAGAPEAHVGPLTALVPARQDDSPQGSTINQSGTQTLAMRFEGTVAPNGAPIRSYAFIRVPLCGNGGAVNVAGKRLKALVRLAGDNGSPGIGGQAHTVEMYNAQGRGFIRDFYVDPSTGGGGPQAYPQTTGPLGWMQLDFDISEEYLNQIPTRSASDITASFVRLRFIVTSGWKGNIYIDNIRIE